MIHLNSNILCTVCIDTTGEIVGIHDLIQICILPLNFTIDPNPNILPFDCILKPERFFDDPSIKIRRREKLAKCITSGLDPLIASDLLMQWFKSLNLPEGKKIMPLSFSWANQKAFIAEWLGMSTFNYIFDYRYRDILTTALYLNDKADVEIEQCPFPKVDLTYLCKTLKLDFEADHQVDVTYDCGIVAAAYKQLLKIQIGIFG